MKPLVTMADFKAAMATFATGVTVITTLDGAGQPAALTANAFASASKNPPLCLVCVSHDADAYPALLAAGRFAVNMLSREQRDLAARFATHGLDKFDGIPWSPGSATGCPLLPDVLAVVECIVTQRVPTGDHDVFVGAIQRIALGDGDPLIHFRSAYRDVTG